MTKNEINILLQTIAETPEGAPSGILYAGMMTAGWDIHDYESAVNFCKGQGLITETSNLIKPTQKLTDILGRLKAAA